MVRIEHLEEESMNKKIYQFEVEDPDSFHTSISKLLSPEKE